MGIFRPKDMVVGMYMMRESLGLEDSIAMIQGFFYRWGLQKA